VFPSYAVFTKFNKIGDIAVNRREPTPPYALAQLRFDSYEDSLAYDSRYHEELTTVWLWHETFGNRPDLIAMPGICDACERRTTFTVTPQKAPAGDPFQYRANWWSALVCGACKMSTIDRLVMHVLRDGGTREDRIYHVGHHSHFRLSLSDKFPNVFSSQYQQGRSPGEIEGGIRYEDVTRLSFPGGEFDSLICTEVLEHVPDYRAALSEMARVLKPNGRAILTFPWLGGKNYDHLVRAEVLPDGSINHILPPEYHGDPASTDGILSFRAFGWKILDEIRESGFSRAYAIFMFAPLNGYMSLISPVIVAIR
jgi:SAM-dependent methyltransferase